MLITNGKKIVVPNNEIATLEEAAKTLKLESGGFSAYTGADERWERKNKDHVSLTASNLFPWSPEVEEFLLKAQAQLDEIGTSVLHFFNESNPETLKNKMVNSKYLSLQAGEKTDNP